MPRAYTIATVAFALAVDSKWADNILSRFKVAGVTQSRQGVSRRISTQGVLQLAVIQRLTGELGVPVEVAVAKANELVHSGELLLGNGLYLRLDRKEELIGIEARLDNAVEATPTPRRGRPPQKTKRGAD